MHILTDRDSILELGRYGKFPVEQLIGKPSGLYLEILPRGELSPISPDDVVCEVDMDDVDGMISRWTSIFYWLGRESE